MMQAGSSFAEQVEALEADWAVNPRWRGVRRDYSAADVVGRCHGTLPRWLWRAARRQSSSDGAWNLRG